MNTSKYQIMAVFTAIIIFVASCRKKEEADNQTIDATRESLQIQAGLDAVMQDANLAASNFGGFVNSPVFSICGAIIDTSNLSQGLVVVTFDGITDCKGLIRSGKLELTLNGYLNGSRWRDSSAVLKVQMNDYTIKRVSSSRSITYNGTKQVTNEKGGTAAYLVQGLRESLVHKVMGSGIMATFEDGKSCSINIIRRFTHTYKNSVYTISGEGIGSHNGVEKVEKWGTTRSGTIFISSALEPVVWNSNCGPTRPTSGKLSTTLDGKAFKYSTTLGVDSKGEVVTSGCPWGLKVEW
jgi:hypothetical protein